MNGYRLDQLRAGAKPFRLHFFPRLRSTNDHAAALRRRGKLFAPAMVLTSHQIAGRGRGSNSWWSGPGCITVTFVLPSDDHLAAHQIPLIAGLAVRDVAAELSGADIQLKWPNDLLYRGRKLAGLLCERVQRADLIGIGLNVNLDPNRAPRGLREQITSLNAITSEPLDMGDVLIRLAQRLHPALSRRRERPFAQVLKDYDAHHALAGRRVTVQLDHAPPIVGTVQGLDSHGRLLVRSRSGLQRIIAGQVQLH
jgi:BirA family biotin operon repressor/biotin-[acetyl-CoA-carboxylase] ligase